MKVNTAVRENWKEIYERKQITNKLIPDKLRLSEDDKYNHTIIIQSYNNMTSIIE